MPRVDDILDQLGGSHYFGTLDLASGYWQVSLKEEDMEKTAFSVGLDHYEFKFMPWRTLRPRSNAWWGRFWKGYKAALCFSTAS